MSDLEAAVAQAAAVFESLGIPYMLIGGLAVSVWGEPRATIDADFTVWTEPDDFEQTVLRLCESFQCLTRNPAEFARGARVLPIRTAQGTRMDIIFGRLPWEKEAIGRAQQKELSGRSVAVASVEDLIVMKLFSEREKDADDARRLLNRFKGKLDPGYLEPLLESLADSLARPEILEAWRGTQSDSSL